MCFGLIPGWHSVLVISPFPYQPSEFPSSATKGIPDRRGNSFQTLHCGHVKLSPHCAVWKSGERLSVMNPNELLRVPECVRALAFSFPSGVLCPLPRSFLFPSPLVFLFPLLLLYPLPLCLSSAVNGAEAHSCFARLSVKDGLWLLFGSQHAESQVTLCNRARQTNSVDMFSKRQNITWESMKISYFSSFY